MFNTIFLLWHRKTAILISVFSLLATAHVSAATLHLISGEIIEGRIVEREADLIKIDTGKGYPFTYYMDEIDTIDGKPVAPAVAEEESLETEEESHEMIGLIEVVEPVETDESIGDGEFGEVIVPPEEEYTEEIETIEIRGTVEIDEPAEAIELTEIKPIGEAGPVETHEQPVEEAITAEEIISIEDIVHDEIQDLPVEPRVSLPIIQMTEPVATDETLDVDQYEEPESVTGVEEDQKARFQRRMTFIRERLEQIPLKVRRDILTVFLLLISAVYVLLCFPFMIIARKLGKKHIWITWIPVVHLFYLVYMAGRPLWWAVIYVVPVVNVFIPLILFVDILKSLQKSPWLIILMIIPGVNLIMTWYLAIARIDQNPE